MYNIICVKHGTKYNSDYVNKLYSMVCRHTTLPFNFYCFTEDTTGLNENIKVIDLPVNKYPDIKGWWWKTYPFREGHFPSEDVNFLLDLDMIIIDNIDEYLTYGNLDEFTCLENLGWVISAKVPHANKTKLGSAILRWRANEYPDIWDTVHDQHRDNHSYGDQDHIWDLYKDEIKFFPREWTVSYKWQPFVAKKKQGKIIAFHGDPKPHQLEMEAIYKEWT